MLAAILLSLSALSLASTNDYIWTTGAAPYRITGYGSGSAATNCIDRGEDVAFLRECVFERRCCASLVSDSTYARAVPDRTYPFPGLSPSRDDASHLFIASFSYDFNSVLRPLAGCCTYTSDNIQTDMRAIGQHPMDDYDIETNVFRNVQAAFPREPIYRTRSDSPSIGLYVISAVNIFALYNDFCRNDSLMFKQDEWVSGALDREYRKTDHSSPRFSFAEMRYVTTNYTTAAVAYATNATDKTTHYYRDTVSVDKHHYAFYDGKAELDAATGSSVSSVEGWNNALTNSYIRFHSYFSNKIDRITAFAALRVSRNTFTTVDGTTTNHAITNAVVLAPVECRRIGPAEDGGPRFAVGVAMPDIATSAVDMLGLLHPGELEMQTFDAIPHPQKPPPRPGYTSRHQVVAQNSITDNLYVSLIGVYGVVSIIYNARELRN